MYECIYKYMYLYIYTYMYICIYIYIYIHMHMKMCVHPVSTAVPMTFLGVLFAGAILVLLFVALRIYTNIYIL